MSNLPAHFNREPKALWQQFYNITQIPRPSKKEEKFQNYLKDFSIKYDLEYFQDKAGNVILKVPGSKGLEGKETIIIQNHMDMVCDTLNGKTHDFEKDPISTLEKDGWIKADGTTLGADNGVGCAAALAIVSDGSLVHPPLELLFTSDEETGLNGALGIETENLSGKIMFNLDTEEWGAFYIGCAGGVDFELEKKIELQVLGKNTKDYQTIELRFLGLTGGHSGCDIHLNRASAIRLLANFLVSNSINIKLSEFNGGKAHNIIPREASCRFHISKTELNDFKSQLGSFHEKALASLSAEDQSFQIELLEHEYDEAKYLSDKNMMEFLTLSSNLPHGAFSYNWKFEEPLVQYSANLARAIIKDGQVYFEVSTRFTHESEVERIEPQIKSLAKLNSFEFHKGNSYPSWTPDLSSKLLGRVKEIYKEMYGNYPEVKAIHAGLECGILKEKLGDVDVVSFGPTITGAHSPDEAIEVKSVEYFWDLLTKTLQCVN